MLDTEPQPLQALAPELGHRKKRLLKPACNMFCEGKKSNLFFVVGLVRRREWRGKTGKNHRNVKSWLIWLCYLELRVCIL